MNTLLLVHGWGAGPSCWQRQEAHFRGRGRVLAPALQGRDAAWLAAYLRNLPLPRTMAVGWSLGGMLLLEAVAAIPLQPAALVLIAAPAVFCRRPDHPWGQPPAAVRAMRQGLTQDPGRVLRNFAHACLADGETAYQTEITGLFTSPADSDGLAAGLDYLLKRDLRPLLHRVTCPVLLLHGAQDRIVPPAQGQWLTQALPDARLRLLPRAGHAPFLTQAALVNAALEEELA
ncbi:MAG: alpha/beta fold hydrolase [Deltaproteobacteria bacterium]|nr:alpha/beta fold hydrolase [Deltaproteobacteria bacterium]